MFEFFTDALWSPYVAEACWYRNPELRRIPAVRPGLFWVLYSFC